MNKLREALIWCSFVFVSQLVDLVDVLKNVESTI